MEQLAEYILLEYHKYQWVENIFLFHILGPDFMGYIKHPNFCIWKQREYWCNLQIFFSLVPIFIKLGELVLGLII